MRLSIRAMSLGSALLWGASILIVCLLHLAIPHYAKDFLDGISSLYPGFHGGASLRDALVGTAYALADGAIGGLLLAWLYNWAVRGLHKRHAAVPSAH